MASSLHPKPNPLPRTRNPTHFLAPETQPTRTTTRVSIRCGPCDNHRPLVKVMGAKVQHSLIPCPCLQSPLPPDQSQPRHRSSGASTARSMPHGPPSLFRRPTYLDRERVLWDSDKGLIRLIKAVISADMRESTVRITRC
ncbi:hypothetical protein FF2_045972 [Malus domestica]